MEQRQNLSIITGDCTIKQLKELHFGSSFCCSCHLHRIHLAAAQQSESFFPASLLCRRKVQMIGKKLSMNRIGIAFVRRKSLEANNKARKKFPNHEYLSATHAQRKVLLRVRVIDLHACLSCLFTSMLRSIASETEGVGAFHHSSKLAFYSLQ